MDILILILQVFAVIGLIFLSMFKKNYFPKYLEEKAKNTATVEDVTKITHLVESVQKEYREEFDKIQKKNEVHFGEIKNNRNRYNSKQFELYNNLWSSLIELKLSADKLWNSATSTGLKDLSNKVSNANKSIEKSSLLIEDRHYKKLKELINKFEEFQFGKGDLIKLRNITNKTDEELKNTNNINEQMIKNVISENESVKIQYDNLLIQLKKDFKKQIKGNDI